MKLEYEHDLPSKSTFDQAVHRWKTLCKSNREITSLAGVVKKDYFQTLEQYCHWQLVPVAVSAPSALRRLKTWQRSSTGNTRFNGLALINIPCDNDVCVIDQDSVLRRFDSTGHLRIGRISTDTVVWPVQLNWRETEHLLSTSLSPTPYIWSQSIWFAVNMTVTHNVGGALWLNILIC